MGGPAPWQSGCGLRRRRSAWYRRCHKRHRPWPLPPARRCWPRSPPPVPAPPGCPERCRAIPPTAVISWESVSTTIAALCPSNRRLLLLWPWRLRVMHRHHPVPAHPVLEAHSALSPFHVLEQQLPQQFRCRHNPLALGAILRQFPLRQPRQLQQPVRVSHNPGQQGLTRPLIAPVDAGPRPSRWNQSIAHIPRPQPIL